MKTKKVNEKVSQNSALEGTWINSYGSLLTIFPITSSGYFQGEYSSTTGSSGRYPLSGYTQNLLDVGNEETNRPVALTIQWESLDGGTPDPSWNWVSAMNGLFYVPEGDTARIQFLHGMTASSEFPAVEVDEPGVYTESLIFTPFTPPVPKEVKPFVNIYKDVIPKIRTERQELLPDYSNNNSNSIFQDIQNFTVNFNIQVTGSMQVTGIGLVAINGFCDREDSVLPLRSMAFSGSYIDPETQKLTTITFTGFIDKNNDNIMTLETFKARTTTDGNKYTAVNIGQETFSPTINP